APVAPQEVAPVQEEVVASAAEPVVAPVSDIVVEAVAPAIVPTPAPVIEEAPTAAARPVVNGHANGSAVDLDAVLRAAGLELASTDPEKLRLAQQEAAKIVVPARVPRERKPLPPLSTEPLIQVETQR
ncbi:MAG: ribonuclease E/G, partial [Oxalicibacterium faecigallinarum]|nr:ribonuclease E/G [Oxalicibacterium faecigallinarum]